jgi:DNA-binding response OmpR family regulator
MVELNLDPSTRTVVHGDQRIRLTPLEFRLLACLAARPGEVVSREELTRELMGTDEEPRSNLIDVYVGYLRKKLGSYAVILTKRGQGYAIRTTD